MTSQKTLHLQVMFGDDILEEKCFSMEDLILGRHLEWVKEQTEDKEVWVNCSEQRLTMD